jgi:hypothetical protein
MCTTKEADAHSQGSIFCGVQARRTAEKTLNRVCQNFTACARSAENAEKSQHAMLLHSVKAGQSGDALQL